MAPPDAFGFEESAAAAVPAPAPAPGARARKKRSVLDAAAVHPAAGQPRKRPRPAAPPEAARRERPAEAQGQAPPPASVRSADAGAGRERRALKKSTAQAQALSLASASTRQKQTPDPDSLPPSENAHQPKVEARDVLACESARSSAVPLPVSSETDQAQAQSSKISAEPESNSMSLPAPEEVPVRDAPPGRTLTQHSSTEPVPVPAGAEKPDGVNVVEGEPSEPNKAQDSQLRAPSALRHCQRDRVPPTRRVRFDPALPESSLERPPILRAVYSSRRSGRMDAAVGARLDATRRRRSMRSLSDRRSRAAAAAAAAAAPIDVTDAVGGARTADERASVDQLQYLLDGVVKGGCSGGESTDELLIGSLAELADLFLSMSPPPPHQRSEAAAEAAAANLAVADAKDARESAKAHARATAAAAALEAAHSQPSMLKRIGGAVLETVVSRLLVLRSRSAPVSLLVGSIMLILAQSDATDQLFGKPQIAALVDAFYQVVPLLVASSAGGETDDRVSALNERVKTKEKRNGKTGGSPEVRKRRRGRLARRVATCDNEGEGAAILRVRSLLRDSCGLEESVSDEVEENAFGVAMVYGLALAGTLEASSKARAVMLESHRVHRIVAVLSEAERQCRAAESTDTSTVSSRPIAAVSLRILEFATLHHGCQDVITRESKVVHTAVSVLRLSSSEDSDAGLGSESPAPIDEKRVSMNEEHEANQCNGSAVRPRIPLYDELVLADALRLCVNLTHNCPTGHAQFVAAGGVKVVLDLIASPAVWPRPGSPAVLQNPLRETFDVRVLSIALLASVITQDKKLGAVLQDVHPHGVPERDGGAVSFVLELLKFVGDSGVAIDKTTENRREVMEVPDTTAEEGVGCREDDRSRDGVESIDSANAANGTSTSIRMAADASDIQPLGDGSLGMDRRVMTGYLCLLLGALVVGSTANRSLVLSAMPNNSLTPIADVLSEFLTFHHELGVVSSSVDDMYAIIIDSLRDGPLSSAVASRESGLAVDLTTDTFVREVPSADLNS